MTVYGYVSFLEGLLGLCSFDDISLNGVQIGCDDRELGKVAFSVDASLHSITEASRAGADIMVVHHGLFWGRPVAIEGAHRDRVKKALDSSLLLFAAHLPLDAHPEVGNNAVMADELGLTEREGFAFWKGRAIGVIGNLPVPLTKEEVTERLGFSGRPCHFTPGGMEKFSRVAIVSGSGSSDTEEAAALGADLFITGEFRHEKYWEAVERGMSVLSYGHYLTETKGVKALMKLTEDMGIETIFIDGETGL